MLLYFFRVVASSGASLLLIGIIVFGLAGIIYDSEWRLEQLSIESITANVITIADQRNALSTQVDTVLDVQSLSLSDVTDIVTEYVTTSFPTESAIPPLNYDTKHWNYPSSVWFVICLVMSLNPMNLTVNSPVTIITSLYLKLAGPAMSVIVIASMASTVNWILYLLTLCIARKPANLPDALTAKYQRNLVLRDSLIMILAVVILLGTLALGAYLYSVHGQTDYVFALMSVIKLLTSSTISEENVEILTKDSMMEVMYWSCMLLILKSALASCFSSIVRFYRTWLNSKNAMASAAELRAYLERERQIKKRNHLIYHEKTE